MNIPVTVGVPTFNRYEALSNCLLSIAMQTVKPQHVIIVDDGERLDIRQMPNIFYTLKLFDHYGIGWEVKWKDQKGQHFSHQLVQDIAVTDWILRLDDDCVLEPNCLELLWKAKDEGGVVRVGAVAPLILLSDPQILPQGISKNTIVDIYSAPNIQWFLWRGMTQVEHLNSSFLYRKGITKYNLNLSKVAHREETIFSHEILRAGYELLVCGDARCWHYRQDSGGIRTHNDRSLYDHDEEIFRNVVKSWNYKDAPNEKIVYLNNGLGDHYAFLHILPKLLTKYGKVTIAACYPDVFFEFPQVKLISIKDGDLLLGNTEKYDVYKFMDSPMFQQGNLKDAFNQLYA